MNQKQTWHDGLIEMCLDDSKDEMAIEKKITDAFHLMYYNSSHTWNNSNTKWMGVPCFQNPLDMWVLQEIIFEMRPTVIIECGSFMGGGSIFFANMMDIARIQEGRVFSIDVEQKSEVNHPRVHKFTGRSTSSLVLRNMIDMLLASDKIMVVLDSDHTTQNVLNEMRIYSKIVSPGQYMVVMDSNLGGNPIHIPKIGPGPMAAIEVFMKGNEEFEIDRGREKFYFTFCPSGWLRKR